MKRLQEKKGEWRKDEDLTTEFLFSLSALRNFGRTFTKSTPYPHTYLNYHEIFNRFLLHSKISIIDKLESALFKIFSGSIDQELVLK